MPTPSHSRSAPERGAALVLVLALVVLLTVLVVAFFARVLTTRQLSNRSFHQAGAAELALSGLEIIIGDLRQEITDPAANRSVSTDGGTTLYLPEPAHVIPVRHGTPSRIDGLNPIPTLVRISTSSSPIPAPGVDHPASGAISTDPSANGKSISPARWNKHELIPRAAGAADSTPIGGVDGFTTPSWVYVTDQGPRVLDAPSGSVIGRYAYAIYDQGALLDVNVAGYPSGMPANASHPGPLSSTDPLRLMSRFGYGGKGSIAFADLGALEDSAGDPLFTSAQADTLVGWRNYASAKPAGPFPALTFDVEAAARFFDSVYLNRDGFLKVNASAWNGQTDQAFLNRQQLLDWQKTLGFDVDALRHLSTFSRSVNTPSWSPPADSEDLPGYVGGPGTTVIAYRADADKPGSANRNLANVRFGDAATLTHYHDDASKESYTVAAGEPLLRSRFSLTRIAWLSQANPDTGAAPSSAYAEAIRECFGLRWETVGGSANGGNPCWSYVGSSGSAFDGTIKTLDQVAEEGREPNFFELLKAGILRGSLGLDPGMCAYHNGAPDQTPFNYHDRNPSLTSGLSGPNGKYAYSFDVAGTLPSPARISDLQIIQIGANIIDQYDADSYPTAIYFKYPGAEPAQDPAAGGNPIFGSVTMVFGNENLPYLNGVMIPFCTTDGNKSGNGISEGLGSWWQPEIWNPHQMPGSATTGAAPPQKFMIRGYGEANTYWKSGDGTASGRSANHAFDGKEITFVDANPTRSAFYDYPRLLTQNTIPDVTATASDGEMLANSNMVGYGTNPFVGFWAGTEYFYNTDAAFAGLEKTRTSRTEATAAPVVSFALGWVDSGNRFHPYSFFTGVFARLYGVVGPEKGSDERGSADPAKTGGEWHRVIDPRTQRFSSVAGWDAGQRMRKTFHSSRTERGGQGGGCSPHAGNFIWHPAIGAPYYGVYGTDWAVNQPVPLPPFTSACRYIDPDGVLRPGDGVYGNPSTGDGMPLFITNGSPAGTPYAVGDNRNTEHGRRPVILNRPFRSVGELGYTFRDLPFKTLDFFSSYSADAALLDLFSLTGEPRITAGQVNINNASPAVIAAILSGGSKKEADPAYNLSPDEAQAIAEAFVKQLNPSASDGGPVANRAEIVARLDAAIKAAALPASYGNKAYREASLRALSSVTNVRTWNLMIDVIAQTGVFPPNAPENLAALNSSFVVQGERRYWLHLAIDRYTGKIVDQQLESVYE